MAEPTMRPIDMPEVAPPDPGAARHLAGFAGAGLLLALGGAATLPAIVGGQPRVFDGALIGWLVGWVAWLTAGEAVRLRFGGPHRARVYLAGFVGGVVLGLTVGLAASAADIEFVLPLPVGGVATAVGAVWLVTLVRRQERRTVA